MNYYRISCKYGHSGSGKYRDIVFYIEAPSVTIAINKAKYMPGVKHNSPSAITGLKTITEEEYIEHRKESAYKNFQKEAD